MVDYDFTVVRMRSRDEEWPNLWLLPTWNVGQKGRSLLILVCTGWRNSRHNARRAHLNFVRGARDGIDVRFLYWKRKREATKKSAEQDEGNAKEKREKISGKKLRSIETNRWRSGKREERTEKTRKTCMIGDNPWRTKGNERFLCGVHSRHTVDANNCMLEYDLAKRN